MKSAVETLAPTRVKLTVEVPHEELKPSLDAAVKAISSQISIPGFRPGKVPARLVEQRVGRGAIVQEAVNEALPGLYGRAVEENDLRPLGQPEVDITEVPVEEGDQLVFTAEVDVRPAIELPDFAGISVTVDPLDESGLDADVEERLTALRQRFGSLVGADRAAAEGDFVTIDLRGVIAGEEIDAVTGVSYEVGSGTMLEGMDEALAGMSADETTTFEAPLAGGDHEGENAEITVTVTAVKVRELPELDDDFAQEASEFDTLEELRASLREQATQAKQFDQGVQARDRVLEHLLEALEIPVPEGVLDAEVHRHLESEDRLDDEEHRGEVEEEARRALATQFLLDTIAEKLEVQVEQQELIEYLVMTAQQIGMDPGQFAQVIDQNNQVPAMASEVARRKGLAQVLEQVSVSDTTGAVVDLNSVTVEDGEGEPEATEVPATQEPAAEQPAEEKPAKKAAAKKPAKKAAAKKDEDGAEKPAKKATAKKAAAKKDEDGAEKPAKKTTAKKTAKKAAAKKDDEA